MILIVQFGCFGEIIWCNVSPSAENLFNKLILMKQISFTANVGIQYIGFEGSLQAILPIIKTEQLYTMIELYVYNNDTY